MDFGQLHSLYQLMRTQQDEHGAEYRFFASTMPDQAVAAEEIPPSARTESDDGKDEGSSAVNELAGGTELDMDADNNQTLSTTADDHDINPNAVRGKKNGKATTTNKNKMKKASGKKRPANSDGEADPDKPSASEEAEVVKPPKKKRKVDPVDPVEVLGPRLRLRTKRPDATPDKETTESPYKGKTTNNMRRPSTRKSAASTPAAQVASAAQGPKGRGAAAGGGKRGRGAAPGGRAGKR